MSWSPLLLAIALALALLFVGRAWLAWVAPGALLLVAWRAGGELPPVLFWSAAVPFAALALATGHRPTRRALLSRRLLPVVARVLPRTSATEREALEAGTTWWEAELFSGRPDWSRLLDFAPRELAPSERAFLEGPVEEVCRMTSEEEALQHGDLPEEVWRFLKAKGFFGMIVPERYGGLGFSAAAHSAVVTRLSTRSVTLAVTVMVPNSLGPAELILHYGTEEQKDHWLPRLASGEEIPAFALTEPDAGSDAGAMRACGTVCRGPWKGEEVLGIRLSWDKRYITLAPAATVMGLAFKLRDPERLLEGEVELGITVALVPTDLPGVEVGERHDPMGVPFLNGPTRGDGVFVPIDAIIGGPAMAGQGWRMLMQSLAAGRGISLPSLSAGACQLAARVVGAYATVREQFGLPIGRFEGVQEPLARIGATAYVVDATRRFTVGAVDAGEKPAIASAIAKRWLTEAMRDVVNDGMDVVGGAGISRGPRNVLAHAYVAAPIGITVEGANILTRSMIVFGQGALRCHPFVRDEVRGAEEGDVALFDRAFFGHVGHVFSNAARSLLLGLTDGRLARVPARGPLGPALRRLTRISAVYALVADVAMASLGSALKRREMLTGRLADALAWQYLASAAIHRFHRDGRPAWALPYAEVATAHAIHRAEEALAGVLANLPARWVARAVRLLVLPLGRRAAPPSDRALRAAAEGLLADGEARSALTRDVHVPEHSEPGLGALEAALDAVARAEPVRRSLKEAVRSGALAAEPAESLHERAVELGLLEPEERQLLAEADAARRRAVAVDSFPATRYAEVSSF